MSVVFPVLSIVGTCVYIHLNHYSFATVQARNAHSVAKRKENVFIKNATFDDTDSFMTWKTEVEVNTQTSLSNTVVQRSEKVKNVQ